MVCIKYLSNIELLYAYDFDGLPIYNSPNTKRVNKVISYLKDCKIDDYGCFVFEINTKNKITFGDVLKSLINYMTEMDFCVAFELRWMYDVKYYKKHKVILFKFDTEAG